MGARRACVAIGLLAVLAGCSGSGNVGAAKTSEAPFVTPSATQTPSHAPLSDKARAQALVLTNNDLGSDWLGDSPGDGSIGDPTAFLRGLQREYGGCSTSSATPKPAATFAGDYFGLEYGNTASLAQSEVGSVAQFYASAPAAKKAFSAAINPGVVACTNRIVKAAIQSVFRALGLSSASAPVAAFRIVPVSSGAQQTGALEFAGKVSYGGESESVYLKLILLRQGRGAVIIYLEDFGTRFPSGLERTLINKVAARLRADGGR